MTIAETKTFNEIKTQIRDAWKKRKGDIAYTDIEDKRYAIKLIVRKPSIVVDGESKKVTENWLVASAADGALVPVFNIELKPQGNMRSTVNKT